MKWYRVWGSISVTGSAIVCAASPEAARAAVREVSTDYDAPRRVASPVFGSEPSFTALGHEELAAEYVANLGLDAVGNARTGGGPHPRSCRG